MAIISFDVTAGADTTDAIAALCAAEGLAPANAANAKAAVILIVKRITKNYRVRVAQASAAAPVVDPTIA